MVTMIGTELSLATLIEDFLQQQVDASDVCHRAARWLADPLARDVVVAFAGIHDRDLEQLRRAAGNCGAHPPEGGGEHAAQRLGQLHLAHQSDGDAAVLMAVARVEDEVIEAYERALANTALPLSLEPLFANALEELRRRRERLNAALRLAA
jgi:uncharacterized protein (TIGR02284 family)